jgi:hypothetical protein
VSGAVHVPQFSTLPQPSPTCPQFNPSCVHVSGVHGGTPHTFAVPPPPHVWLPVHVPHTAVRPPHPSATCPQFAPSDAHVAGVQFGAPHAPGVPPPPQVSGGVQSPQSMTPPHPSPLGPHVMPTGHACGTHALASPTPHTPGVPPPPHVAPPVHAGPQEIVPPHPSLYTPHVMPVGHDAAGVHPLMHTPSLQTEPVGQSAHVSVPPQPSGHTPHTSAPASVFGHAASGVHVTHLLPMQVPASHVPQSSVLPHPSAIDPHTALAAEHVVGEHVTGGRFVSEPTQEDRSSSMYSSAFSCGVSLPDAQSSGVVLPALP